MGQSLPLARLAVEVTDHDHVLGPWNAPLTLVEYGDYECPYCLNALPLIQAVRERLGDRMRFVFRHFPQNTVHPNAGVAAQAAEAAAAQGKFWDMHAQLFAHQADLADIDLTHLALRIGLEVYRFQGQLASEDYAPIVRQQFLSGLHSGVNGTPTFFINGVRYDGPHELEPLVAAMEAAE